MNRNRQDKTIGLYVHIPFCLSKCAYCDFCSSAGSTARQRAAYLNALELNMRDMSAAAEGYIADTVFIGGGTPPVIGVSAMRKLIDGIYRNFYVPENAEFTVEANPATLNRKFAEALVAGGVNRVSIGLQSAQDNELRALGRIHTQRDFEESYTLLRNAGIENINVDVMYGIPEQTPESFLNTLKYVLSLQPEHISAYGLQVEPGTPFYARRDRLELPNEDEEYSMYVYACEYLGANGYKHYEISNFARRGKECAHNRKYWNLDPYIGLGAAAHSFFDGVRTGYSDDVRLYVDAMRGGKDSPELYSENRRLTPEDMETEYVMLRLRLAEGIDKNVYKALFGTDFDLKYKSRLEGFVKGGFVAVTENGYALTTDGMYVSNTVLSSVLDL